MTSTDDNLLVAIQQEYKILAEYKMIQMEDVGGVYVIPSHENSFFWFGVIFVREGYYKDGIFRFNISLPDKFPNDKTAPKVIFQNNIFHSLICPFTGILDLSFGFPEWQPGINHIWQILKYIKYIFLYPIECQQQQQMQQQIINQTSNQGNKIASELLSQNKIDEFISKVNECVIESNERIYDDTPPPTNDKHYIQFEKFDPNTHGVILENLKKQHQDFKGNNVNYGGNNGCSGSGDGSRSVSSIITTGTLTSSSPPISAGISWVKEGEFKPLSKD